MMNCSSLIWLVSTIMIWLQVHVVIAGSHHKLLVGSFNLHAFGKQKASDPAVMSVLSNIISRYDLVSLLELRDVDFNSIQKLVDNLHDITKHTYGLRISPRMGSTTMQEQIAYLFRSDKLESMETYLPDTTKFERPPFFGLFRSRRDPKFKFLTAAVHLKPASAIAEMNQLPKFYWERIRKYHLEHNLSSALLLGDFNADGDYVPNKEWSNVRLHTDAKYRWLIPTGARTNTKGEKSYAYDRIVLYEDFMPSIESMSSGVFYFDQDSHVKKLMRKQKVSVESISDHYPIETKLIIKPLSLDLGMKKPQSRSFFSWLFGWNSGLDSKPTSRTAGQDSPNNQESSSIVAEPLAKPVEKKRVAVAAKPKPVKPVAPKPRRQPNPPKPQNSRAQSSACKLNTVKGFATLVKRDCIPSPYSSEYSEESASDDSFSDYVPELSDDESESYEESDASDEYYDDISIKEVPSVGKKRKRDSQSGIGKRSLPVTHIKKKSRVE